MQAIIDFFTSVIHFWSSMVESIIWLVTSIPNLLTSLAGAYAYTPDFIKPFVVYSVSLIAVFAIIRLI